MSRTLDIVFCGDDFTGASDTLATLARGGKHARLYLQPPSRSTNPEIDDLDAIGLATSLRAMSRGDAQTSMQAMAPALVALQPRFHHFKICSTFDSAPDLGNISAAVDDYARDVNPQWIAIIGGQPSLGRYCIFGNLFAADSKGCVHRIDRHPVMRNHPVTPMQESDLRLHLQAQGWYKVGLIDIHNYQANNLALAETIAQRIATGETHTLLDTASQADIQAIGEALRQLAKRYRILCVGASGVAEALTGNADEPALSQAFDAQINGPILAMAGSRSAVTATQIATATRYRKIPVPPVAIVESQGRAAIAERCREELRLGHNTLLYLTAETGHDLTAHAIATAMADCLAQIVETASIGCLAVAGGDTSSIAVQALAIESLSVIGDIQRGVPLLCAHSAHASLNELPIILKGGQMGGEDLFDRIADLRTGCHNSQAL